MDQILQNVLKTGLERWLTRWMKEKKCADLFQVTLSIVPQPLVRIELPAKKERPVMSEDLEPKAFGPWAQKYRLVRPARLEDKDWENISKNFAGDGIFDTRYQSQSLNILLKVLRDSQNRPVKVLPAPYGCNPSDSRY